MRPYSSMGLTKTSLQLSQSTHRTSNGGSVPLQCYKSRITSISVSLDLALLWDQLLTRAMASPMWTRNFRANTASQISSNVFDDTIITHPFPYHWSSKCLSHLSKHSADTLSKLKSLGNNTNHHHHLTNGSSNNRMKPILQYHGRHWTHTQPSKKDWQSLS